MRFDFFHKKKIHKRELAIGDRVVAIGDCTFHNVIGKFGTIVGFENILVGVNFEDYTEGHDCDGMAELYHGRWMLPDELVLVKRPTINIKEYKRLVDI